ncbi:uncharacterized protein LOC120632117 [Pararge aegeria]|uniref:Jg14950 protein n=1 Tax=Pararge aegeria aegeria TaxID=348720 RepID=A0A8S4SHF4_9NEOP|nr:uncharacterized protein LOC120632117 [Pararge aegeria]CAH2266782.1 jg14950 [Pararge aegeria aegeria]
MYRLLVLCAILNLAEPTWIKRHCHNKIHRNKICPETPNLETLLQIIEREFIEHGEKFQNFCTNTTPHLAREMYGTDNYYLTYSLPAEDTKVTVQIKHKFIHTTVAKKNGNNEKIFEDVAILPDMVKPEDAVYVIQNKDLLKITIPYKVPFGKEVARDCGVINKNVIDVPAVVYPKFTYRFLSNDDEGNGEQ